MQNKTCIKQNIKHKIFEELLTSVLPLFKKKKKKHIELGHAVGPGLQNGYERGKSAEGYHHAVFQSSLLQCETESQR